jgi:hypothetical protein
MEIFIRWKKQIQGWLPIPPSVFRKSAETGKEKPLSRIGAFDLFNLCTADIK